MKAGKRRIKLKLKRLQREIQEATKSNALPCLCCAAEEHYMCTKPDFSNDVCCCVEIVAKYGGGEDLLIGAGGKVFGGQVKAAEDITDVQSTGRKRAKEAFPIPDGMVCEWATLKKAGGGVVPITGCFENKATDRHHGPDKNTLNNNQENVHRICSYCHNYWHALNDKYYGKRPAGTEPFIPLDGYDWGQHDCELHATPEELIAAQLGRKQQVRT